MDNINMHHFSLTVDPGMYVEQLKADPQSGVSPEDEAALTSAGIEVEVWISASDRYMHQMKIDMTTSQFTWNVIYHFSSFVAPASSTAAYGPKGQTPTFSRSRSFSAGLGGGVPYCRRSSSVRCPAAIINST
jgi:hypothetical protein